MQQQIFRSFLGEKGLKLTKERIALLDHIFSFKGHFEPEDLYLKIKAAGIKASRASVYRTLTLLVESGLIEKVTRTDRGNLYEHKLGRDHHDHMICDTCGEISEFYSEKIEKLQDEICDKHFFNGISHTLVIRGTCRQCKTK